MWDLIWYRNMSCFCSKNRGFTMKGNIFCEVYACSREHSWIVRFFGIRGILGYTVIYGKCKCNPPVGVCAGAHTCTHTHTCTWDGCVRPCICWVKTNICEQEVVWEEGCLMYIMPKNARYFSFDRHALWWYFATQEYQEPGKGSETLSGMLGSGACPHLI